MRNGAEDTCLDTKDNGMAHGRQGQGQEFVGTSSSATSSPTDAVTYLAPYWLPRGIWLPFELMGPFIGAKRYVPRLPEVCPRVFGEVGGCWGLCCGLAAGGPRARSSTPCPGATAGFQP